MPHMDMSQAEMQGSFDGTDYSDFEHQQFTLSPPLNSSGNANLRFLYEFEPLFGQGGLDNNEVAELVYHEIQVGLEFEDEAADQNVGTSAEIRGMMAANINSGDGLQNTTTNLNEVTGGSQSGAAGTDDRVFQVFQAIGSPPFDDQTNGPGGAGPGSHQIYEKMWRMITGRGPVLDSTDDITITGNLVVGDQLSGITLGSVRGQLIWDTAEVSDAGRAFSVPR